ncbi:MAG: hypothetical protein PHD83_00805 [Caldisericia bacterium]|nr:hypothetical protein [Caldisericia bacterium]
MKKTTILGVSLFFVLACFCFALMIIKSEFAGKFQAVIIFSGIFLVLFSVLLLLELKLRLMEKNK